MLRLTAYRENESFCAADNFVNGYNIELFHGASLKEMVKRDESAKKNRKGRADKEHEYKKYDLRCREQLDSPPPDLDSSMCLCGFSYYGSLHSDWEQLDVEDRQ